MREKYNVRTKQEYHLKSLMSHFKGSFKLIKDTKINMQKLGDAAAMRQSCVVKNYAPSLPGY